MGKERNIVVLADSQAEMKKKAGSCRSWILMDAEGKSTVLDVDKYAIMDRVQIHARDLRILDPLVLPFHHSQPRLLHPRRVLLRDPLDDNVIPVVEELQRRLPFINSIREGQEDGNELGDQQDVEAGGEDESPFEFRALEVALEAICSFFDARTTELETATYPALDELTSKISTRNLDQVRKLKSAMTRLTARVQKVRDELEQLLDDDDDIADLYLSRKLAGPSSPVSGLGAANWCPASPTIGSKKSRARRASVATFRGDENDVEELEMLLELREFIDDIEDYINIQLIQLELLLTSAGISVSLCSTMAGIFGANIPFTWNSNHGYMFKWW
ncbi:unnamed protein product [Camellia sinensis]